MSIVGIGTDIVSIERIRNIENLDRFSQYILNKKEIDEMEKSRDKIQFIASRFAAKESLIKALPQRINYLDIITHKTGEKFTQKVANKKLSKYKINSSISHSFENAVAVSIVEI